MYDNIITIEDNNGNITEFIKIDMYKNSKNTYFALLDVDNKQENVKNILLTKINYIDINNTELIIISSKKELSKVINLFLERWSHEKEISFVNSAYSH